MKPFQSSDEWGQITTTRGRSAVLLQLQVSKLQSILVTSRLNVTVLNLHIREGQGGHVPPPDPTTGGQRSLSIFLAPCQTTAIPCKTLTIRYSKYTPMSWAQPDHTIFNSHAIYMMLTQKFTCPFPEKYGGLPPPITFLWPSLVVCPTWQKGTHAEKPQLSGSMKSSFWFILDVFLNHLCSVESWGYYMCVENVIPWFLWTLNSLGFNCHAVVIIVSSAYPKTPPLGPLFSHIDYVKFILVLCPCLWVSQEVPLAKRGCKLFPLHEASFLWFL